LQACGFDHFVLCGFNVANDAWHFGFNFDDYVAKFAAIEFARAVFDEFFGFVEALCDGGEVFKLWHSDEPVVSLTFALNF